MTADRDALIAILRNQTRLADMIANARGLSPAELQNDANRVAIEAYEAINRLADTAAGDRSDG